MSNASSERQSTNEGTPVVTLGCASTPKDALGFSKAGRRVLAELACNDSPVIGLLPPGTPASCKQTSSSGGGPLKRSRRALLSNPPSHCTSTPLGESLLRSQVQLLLQKVESDTCAPMCPRACAHPSMRSGFMMSPTMLAAPTPLNTPAAMAPAPTLPDPISAPEVNVQNVSTVAQIANMDWGNVQSICMIGTSQDTIGVLKGHASSAEQRSVQNGLHVEEPHHHDVSFESGPDTSLVSKTCLDKKPLERILVLSKVSDVPSPPELFSGKRVLQFDDNTPCKASPTKQLDAKILEQLGHHSLVRELDDDEVSEWSVHVNVGSPSDKQSFVEQTEHAVLVEIGDLSEVNGEVSSSLHEHVKEIQKGISSKVDLLWRKGRERKASLYGNEDEHYEEGVEEEYAGYSEQYYSGNEEDEGGCDNLCDMFKVMRFEEHMSKGLPRAEGKHIRFLYGEDDNEIVDAIAIKREEEISQGSTAMRLNGLPVPQGRHWRFVQNDDDEEEQEEGCAE